MILKSQLMDEMGMKRALKRISHEILEKNKGADNLLLIGIRRRGVPLAHRISDFIEGIEGVRVPVKEVDITLYRDDLSELKEYPVAVEGSEQLDVAGKKVILVDDVLYTAPPSMPSSPSDAPRSSSWGSSSTGDTVNCPSGQIMSVKTSPLQNPNWSKWRSGKWTARRAWPCTRRRIETDEDRILEHQWPPGCFQERFCRESGQPGS